MKYAIIANGPFLTEDIIAEAVKVSDRIVVLDGALGQLASLGINPHIIIGDFDSIDDQQKKIWGIPEKFSLERNPSSNEPKCEAGKYKAHIIFTPNQDFPDLYKALQLVLWHQDGSDDAKTYLKTSGFEKASQIDVLCALDGRMDHHLGNIRMLETFYRKDVPIYLHHQGQSLQYVHDSSIIRSINRKLDTKQRFAIFGSPASFTSEGLKWDGEVYDPNNAWHSEKTHDKDGYKLDSICNYAHEAADKVSLNITGCALIMIPACFDAQERYSEMTPEIEREIYKNKIDQLNRHLIETSFLELYKYEQLLMRSKMKNASFLSRCLCALFCCVREKSKYQWLYNDKTNFYKASAYQVVAEQEDGSVLVSLTKEQKEKMDTLSKDIDLLSTVYYYGLYLFSFAFVISKLSPFCIEFLKDNYSVKLDPTLGRF